MRRSSRHPTHEANGSGQRVELPRPSDAIGVALRDAFERDFALPEDMRAILRELNGPESRPSC